jgi:succinoglycan biosynthesis protein ExoA
MNSEYPMVSVIMPIRNEAAFIAGSLEAVVEQDYPHDRLEVIVADGMSTDGTRDIVRSLRYRDPSVRLIDNPGQIPSAGLNAALRQARGEIIVRVDGHCEVERCYIRTCVECLRRGGADAVGGACRTIGQSSVGRAIAAAMSSRFGVGDSAFRTRANETIPVDTLPFPAYTRAIIERVGWFDEELVRNQDDEYNYRLRQMGGKLLLVGEVHTRYYARDSLGGLWRQYFDYGFWKVRVMQKHPRQMRPRQFVPPAFAATLIASAGLAPVSAAARAMLIVVAAAYGGADLVASAWTARQAGWRCLPMLPMAFAALHLSYGVGFLAGLVRFRSRWLPSGQA